ncbi:TPA: Gfo/Idh/MocA family oxidoreductase [Candidatus Poribacteria bacterium]|nr:Gfo/Idh/MocA family oxidoreductase [Candidatus Poribacteria bacterium]
MTFKVGIIGLHHLHSEGYIQLLGNLPDADVTAISDGDEPLLRQIGGRYEISELYTDWRDLIRNSDVDLVIILLPHAMCPDAAVQACRAGKHVIVEKPMSNRSEGILRMISAARDSGAKLTTPYLWRYCSAAEKIKEMIDEGRIGRIVAFEGRNVAGPPRRYPDGGAEWMIRKEISGGGPLHNLGVHWIDLFRWISGQEILSVAAKVNSLTHGLEIEDNSHALLVFESGAVASLDISYSAAYGYDLFVQVRGTEGVISWRPQMNGPSVIEIARGRERDVMEIEEGRIKGYGGVWGVKFLRDFLKAIEEDSRPPITGEDGYRALKVVEAAYKSSREGRFVEVG